MNLRVLLDRSEVGYMTDHAAREDIYDCPACARPLRFRFDGSTPDRCDGGCDVVTIASLAAARIVDGSRPPSPQHQDRLRVTTLAGVTARHQKWTWAARVPRGEMTLLAGPEGVGKSTFLAWFVAGITRGTLDGDLCGQPRAVLIAALEDDVATTLRPRMEAAGADLNLVGCIDGPSDEPLTLPEHLELIEAEVHGARYPVPIGAIVLDPVKSTIPGVGREENVRPVLARILKLAQENDIDVILASHFKKGSANEDFAAWMVSGTPAWTQVPRSVLFFSHDPEADEDDLDARLIGHAKCNVGRLAPTIKARVVGCTINVDGAPLGTSRLELGGESAVRPGEFGKADREQRSAQSEAAEFLRSYLADGLEHERSEVMQAGKADGHSDAALRRAATRARVVKRRSGAGSDHRAFWSLPVSAVTSAHSAQSAQSQAPPALTLRTPTTLRTVDTSLCARCGAALTETPTGPVCVGCESRGDAAPNFNNGSSAVDDRNQHTGGAA